MSIDLPILTKPAVTKFTADVVADVAALFTKFGGGKRQLAIMVNEKESSKFDKMIVCTSSRKRYQKLSYDVGDAALDKIAKKQLYCVLVEV